MNWQVKHYRSYHEMKHCNHIFRSRAFSLIEMLAAMSLFFVCIMLLFTLGITFAQRWKKEMDVEQTSLAVTMLLKNMTRDLHEVVPIPNSFFLNLSTKHPDCRKNIFFLIAHPSSRGIGDLTAVGYFLVAENNSPGTYHCYRFLAEPNETRAAFEQKNLNSLFASASPSNRFCHECTNASFLAWNITPEWLAHGCLLPQGKQNSFQNFPNLLEITLSTAISPPNTSLTKEPKKVTFSTTIALPTPH